MGIASDQRLSQGGRRPTALASVPAACRSGLAYLKRRHVLSDTIEWLIGCVRALIARDFVMTLVLMDSTPVECGRSIDRDQRAARSWLTLVDYGFCAQPQPLVLGDADCTCWPRPDGAPRACDHWPRPTRKSATSRCACCRSVCEAAARSIIARNKGYAGKELRTPPSPSASAQCSLRPTR